MHYRHYPNRHLSLLWRKFSPRQNNHLRIRSGNCEQEGKSQRCDDAWNLATCICKAYVKSFWVWFRNRLGDQVFEQANPPPYGRWNDARIVSTTRIFEGKIEASLITNRNRMTSIEMKRWCNMYCLRSLIFRLYPWHHSSSKRLFPADSIEILRVIRTHTYVRCLT